MNRLLKFLSVSAVWLLVWEGMALLVGKELLLPAPPVVLCRLAELAATAEFWRTVGYSLLRIACGVLGAVTLGTALAVMTAHSRLMKALLGPPLAVIKATPVASFIILALLWMGRDILPAFISALVVLPVVWTNVETGIRETERELLEVARVFCFTGAKTVARVYVPSVLPYFAAACRASIGMGWKAGIAAEVLTVPLLSIGKRIYESKLYWETTDLFAWTVAVILCSLVIEKLLMAAVAQFERRGTEAAHD